MVLNTSMRENLTITILTHFLAQGYKES